MAMQGPPHPGGMVRRQCLEPLGLTVTRAAEGLGVTRQALSDLVNERAGISTEMAIRLSKAFGSTPETWIGMQMAYDLWQARGRDRGRAVRGGLNPYPSTIATRSSIGHGFVGRCGSDRTGRLAIACSRVTIEFA